MTTAPYYQDEAVTLHHADCMGLLSEMPDGSVDSVCTDPPYELTSGKKGGTGAASVNLNSPHGRSRIGTGNGAGGFMGKQWDATGIAHSVEFWAECLRVLKPGGHLLAFGGSRTWHRLAVAVEDAGFQLRDSIAWLYASGFPKSLNVSKDARFCQCLTGGSGGADNQMRGVRDDVPRPAAHSEEGGLADLFAPVQREGARTGVGDTRTQGASGPEDVNAAARGCEPSMEGRRDAQAGEGQLLRRAVCPLPGGVLSDGTSGRLHHGAPSGDGAVDRTSVAPVGGRESQGPRPVEQRPIEPGAVSIERGSQARGGGSVCERCGKPTIRPGLGTALKPAFEPIVVARKPLSGTVAANVQQHGTGALNIDACRVPGDEDGSRNRPPSRLGSATTYAQDEWTSNAVVARQDTTGRGRWPANVVLDESQAAELDQQTGVLTSGKLDRSKITAVNGDGWRFNGGRTGTYEQDSGGASRFFYVAKAPSSQRPKGEDGSAHPTVKPLDLMRWLVRLVTPPGGVVLEPFAGSGTTVEACLLEGFRCIAVEREAAYLPLILQRISKPLQPGIDFGASA